MTDKKLALSALETEDVSIPVDGAPGHGAHGGGADGGGTYGNGASRAVVHIEGRLSLPKEYRAVIVFAHGSGSSRRSPRNAFVASVLNEAGFGTFLLDLLTPDEEAERSNVFDIELLAQRLVEATRWVRSRRLQHPPAIGFFGASTGAGAALRAAAELGDAVGSVVSRGGRVDLAGASLAKVTAPTLLIVGGDDLVVLELNREAMRKLTAPTRLEVIPGATHLFEEPGALEQVASLAANWFSTTLEATP